MYTTFQHSENGYKSCQWGGTFLRGNLYFFFYLIHPLNQGSSNLSLEVQSAAEFSSNPDQTHLPVI